MRIVTFSEIVPGMVLYPVECVKSPGEELNIYDCVLIADTEEAGTSKFWGDSRTMSYIDGHDAYSGLCYTSSQTEDSYQWYVVDDQVMLDKLRVHIKEQINKSRDHLTICERLVDENL